MDAIKFLLFEDNLYWRLLFVCSVLIILLLIFRFSEKMAIKCGLYLFAICVSVNFFYSFFTDSYWVYMLHWFLSTISFLVFWYVTIYISNEYGRPYTGEGAMIILLPLLYVMPLALFVSIVIKGFMVLIRDFN
jgi:hypothetical protein